MNIFSGKRQKVNLDSVYLEYLKISEAPTLTDLQATAETYGISLEILLRTERDKLYKSQNSFGEIFLIQNPACWKERKTASGMVYRTRPKPKQAPSLIVDNDIKPIRENTPTVKDSGIGGHF